MAGEAVPPGKVAPADGKERTCAPGPCGVPCTGRTSLLQAVSCPGPGRDSEKIYLVILTARKSAAIITCKNHLPRIHFAAMIEVAESQEYPAIFAARGQSTPPEKGPFRRRAGPYFDGAGCLGRWENISRTATYHLCGALSLVEGSLRRSFPPGRVLGSKDPRASVLSGRRTGPLMIFTAMNASTRKVHGAFLCKAGMEGSYVRYCNAELGGAASQSKRAEL